MTAEAAKNNTGNDLTIEDDNHGIEVESEIMGETTSQRMIRTTPQRGEDLMTNLLQHHFSTNSFGQGTNQGNVEQMATYAT